ncbi:lanthionine synthetase C family protein [Sorangium sp. So ce1000]|uniref:lanthionine synthetase C family protein n=1 Tax=Sorangium sp. So ce1000 TaxID=3133325 RepID=UPI003F5FC79A
MLHEPERHEPLTSVAWDERAARDCIEAIVRDTEARSSEGAYWPLHPKDMEPGDDPSQPAPPLYHGAAGVLWALGYLQAAGAAPGARRHGELLDALLGRNRAWLASIMPGDERAAFLMGDTPILLMAQGERPTDERADRLAALIEGNLDHPARELMWGAPGTMLAASFLHERFGDARWADLFRRTAARLWSQLAWSDEHGCHFWSQDLYGRRSTYLDAVHGFVATARVLLRGRHLLDAGDWAAWEQVITTTIARTATREGGMASWRAELSSRGDAASPRLMQFCHGAPGFVICLSELPSHALDELLLAAGEAIWAAGPLRKGSNLCHGTGGNGYAFLKLHERTGDALWLDRARAFAMHGILQTQVDARRYGQLRYSLWTGDLGFAVYLWDCIRAEPAFPTLDVFYPYPHPPA